MDPKLSKYPPIPSKSKWKIEEREVLHKSKWHRYMHDKGFTDHGKAYDYFYLSKEFSVGILALTEDQKMILVKQYRYLTNRDSLEVPGGGCRDDRSPEQAAADELVEETGYKASNTRKIGEFDVANGHSTDIAHIFLATGCKKVSEQKLDTSEEGMAVELHAVDQVYEMVQDGKITDSFTLAALLLAWPHIL